MSGCNVILPCFGVAIGKRYGRLTVAPTHGNWCDNQATNSPFGRCGRTSVKESDKGTLGGTSVLSGMLYALFHGQTKG